MGDDLMQMFYLSPSGTKTLMLTKKSTTRDLFKAIAEKERVDLNEMDMYVVFGGKPIAHPDKPGGEDVVLGKYGMKERSNVSLLIRLRGGINPQNLLKTKKSSLTALPPHISITTEPDMVSLNDDTDVTRAKMPCGHVIGPATMTTYARSLLSEGAFSFTCPHVDSEMRRCNRVWDYFLVRHVAALTDEEQKEFETQMNKNLLETPSIRQCPGCKFHCQRIDQKNPRVICDICTKRNKSRYEFCWYCRCTWKTSGTSFCGNTVCEGKDGQLRILREAAKKEISGVANCPSTRSCPNCDIMILHDRGCKHMQCTWCMTHFCFICLKKVDGNGKWQCGDWNSKCTLAPIQE